MSPGGARAVAARDLRVASRRWTPFLVRLGYLGSLGLLLWTFVERLSWQGSLTSSVYADLGRDLFLEASGLQYLLVSLSAALAACDLISGEVRRGTLGLLALSPLGGRAIAVGKWQAAMAQTGLLWFAGAPVLAVCVFLGGADVAELSASLIMTAALASLSAAVAVYFSSITKRGWTALVWTALSLFAWHVVIGIPMISITLGNRQGGGEELAATVAAALLPALAAVMALPVRVGFDMTAGWVSSAVLISLCTVWLLRKAGRRVEARITDTPAPPDLPNAEDEISPRFKSARLGLFAPKGEVWDHDPLLWKERRIAGSGFLGADLRQMLLLMVPVTVYFACILDKEGRYYLPFWWAPVLLPLTIFNGVSLFAGEKEGRRWDVLLSTPLTASQIVRGKLLGGFLGADLLVPFLPCLLLVSIFDANRTFDIAVSALVAGLFVAYAYVVAAAAGLHCATIRGAVTLAGIVLAATAFGPEFWREFVDSSPGLRWYARTANPAELLDRLSRGYYSSGYGTTLGQFRGYLAYYGIATGLVTLWIVLAFDRFAGRGSSP
jgi:ABC-type transport system involved in multi-copper enzyme maturation permease subunit